MLFQDSNQINKETKEMKKLMDETQDENNSFLEFVLRAGKTTIAQTFLFLCSFDKAEGIGDPALTVNVPIFFKSNYN